MFTAPANYGLDDLRVQTRPYGPANCAVWTTYECPIADGPANASTLPPCRLMLAYYTGHSTWLKCWLVLCSGTRPPLFNEKRGLGSASCSRELLCLDEVPRLVPNIVWDVLFKLGPKLSRHILYLRSGRPVTDA